MWIAIAVLLIVDAFLVYVVLHLMVIVLRLDERLKEIEKDSFGAAVTTVKSKTKVRTMWGD